MSAWSQTFSSPGRPLGWGWQTRGSDFWTVFYSNVNYWHRDHTNYPAFARACGREPQAGVGVKTSYSPYSPSLRHPGRQSPGPWHTYSLALTQLLWGHGPVLQSSWFFIKVPIQEMEMKEIGN